MPKINGQEVIKDKQFEIIKIRINEGAIDYQASDEFIYQESRFNSYFMSPDTFLKLLIPTPFISDFKGIYQEALENGYVEYYQICRGTDQHDLRLTTHVLLDEDFMLEVLCHGYGSLPNQYPLTIGGVHGFIEDKVNETQVSHLNPHMLIYAKRNQIFSLLKKLDISSEDSLDGSDYITYDLHLTNSGFLVDFRYFKNNSSPQNITVNLAKSLEILNKFIDNDIKTSDLCRDVWTAFIDNKFSFYLKKKIEFEAGNIQNEEPIYLIEVFQEYGNYTEYRLLSTIPDEELSADEILELDLIDLSDYMFRYLVVVDYVQIPDGR